MSQSSVSQEQSLNNGIHNMDINNTSNSTTSHRATGLQLVSDKINFSVEEDRILEYWDKIKAFETSLEQSKKENRPLYTFYDGPPFATGLPHYGHILAGTIKDVVTRFAHQNGYHVERRFGWDCLLGDSRINLGNGSSVRLDRLVESRQKQVMTWDVRGGIGTFALGTYDRFFEQGVRSVIRVTLEDGRTLTCTSNHQVMKSNGQWCHAADLTVGQDRLMIGAEYPFIDLTLSDWQCYAGGIRLAYDTVQSAMHATSFASILGYFLTDGTLFWRTDRGGYACIVYLGHEVDCQHIINDIDTLVQKRPVYRYREDRNLYQVQLPNELAVCFARLLGVSGVGRRAKKRTDIPSFLMETNCPLPVTAAFLGGLMGGDGHAPYVAVDKSGRTSLKSAAFSATKSTECIGYLNSMLTQIQQLFARFGIEVCLHSARETTMSKKKNAGVEERSMERSFSIPNSALPKLAELIGYRYCAHKQERLALAASYRRMHHNISSLNHDVVVRADQLSGYSQVYNQYNATLSGTALFTAIRRHCTAPMATAHNLAVTELSNRILRESDVLTYGQLKHNIKLLPKRSLYGIVSVEKWLKEVSGMDRFREDLSPCERTRYGTADRSRVASFALKVVRVEQIGEAQVYDIRVPDTSNFVANGVVCHNCHGLPVEHEIDQKLNIKSRDDVLAMGIDKYNAECRSIVQRYTAEWEHTVKRVGRWIDFEHGYKTMDLTFMESVWWVFKQLYNKGLVYKGFKVMPYSTACTTPLSNFEANLNYKDVSDPAVIVTFPIVGDENTSFLAWTTTPWTLPSNLALAVNPRMTYIKVRDNKSGKQYIFMKARVNDVYPPKKAKMGADKAGGKDKKKVKNDVKQKEEAAPDASTTTKPTSNTNKQQRESQPVTPPSPQQQAHHSSPREKNISVAASDAKQSTESYGTHNHTVPHHADGQASTSLPPHDDYTVLDEFLGETLKNMHYEPIFPYFKDTMKTAFRVVCADYVTDESGTGVVHNAPMFGEDDMITCMNNGIISKGSDIAMPVDDAGRFTGDVSDFAGKHVKEADKDIIQWLKQHNRLFNSGSIVHSYPFCWRSDTPLIYRAVPSWFVAVEKVKDKLIEANNQTAWVPEHVQTGRFANWLKDARDWAISRNRYWGTPIPIWSSEDGKEIVVIGSVKELSDASGVPAESITDLHSDKIAHVTIPSSTPGNPPLKRLDLVFDCWFESGSMPYAQQHYPFVSDEANKRFEEQQFPADFVSEGLDQTRGWFYTLMVLSTCLFGQPAFKHLICSGLVLASDGKKMSKRLKNYPDPLDVIHKYGADALRLYLISSPVVKAEQLRFKEEGVFDLVKTVFLPWFHSYRFAVENIARYEAQYDQTFQYDEHAVNHSSNLMDRWIQASLQTLIQFVHEEMTAYRLYTVVPKLLLFIEQLTNWYVRVNKKRLKGSTGREDSIVALSVLTSVLLALCRLMAPFTPFVVEMMYQNLKHVLPKDQQHDSVHYLMLPTVDKSAVDPIIERQVTRMQSVVELGRTARDNRKLSVKRPLKSILIVHKDTEYLWDVMSLHEYIQDELNVQQVLVENNVQKHATLVPEPNMKLLGPRFGKSIKDIVKNIQSLSQKQLEEFDSVGHIELNGQKFSKDDIMLRVQFKGQSKDLEAVNGDAVVIIDTSYDASLEQQWLAREMTNRVQLARKAAGLNPTDDIDIYLHTDDATLNKIIQAQQQYIQSILLKPLYLSADMKDSGDIVYKYDSEIATDDTSKMSLTVFLTKPTG